ncbi:MAG: glycosyltransferase family 2 protein [Anaerolineales bacterium]
MNDALPRVSVIVPCYNEEHTINGLLDALDQQTLPGSQFEIVIADGLSTDQTRSVIRTAAQRLHSLDIHIVDNPERNIPSALNQAIAAARGEVIIRLDAHSKPAPDYLERCLELLKQTGAANVGGIWQIEPFDRSWIARSIAAAASHPLGAGDARYRVGGEAGEVDTVPFGAYPRQWLEKVGPFNENLLTNEDYEYNVRVRQKGGAIWFDPSIRAIYYARASFTQLARQYARYGYWKARMLLENPTSLRWRQALPPLFVLSALVLLAAGPFFLLARGLLAVQLVGYGLITTMAGLVVALRKEDLQLALGFPIALWIMHFTWGGSFLWSVITGLFRRGHEKPGL